MALMPESLNFTPEEQAKLEDIRAKARARHIRERAAAAKRGRKDYPMLPYECSWAYEEEFRRLTSMPDFMRPQTSKPRFTWLQEKLTC